MCVPYVERLMSKADWFEKFEYLQAEHPDMTDEELSEMATERQRDEYAERADQINDERWLREKADAKDL